jgi:hypothetical protein
MPAGNNSAGTRDKAVERIEEGLAPSASGNAQTRGTFDAGRAGPVRRPKPSAVIDTSGTSGLDPYAALRRGESNSGL